MKILNTVLIILLLILATAAFGLLLVGLTGRDLRTYTVMAPDASIEIAGKNRRVSDLAAEYLPAMHIRTANPSPPLLWAWYEAVKTESGVDLVYYQVWEDEINPNPLIQWVYEGFHPAYYGSPVRDIEYFQVSVSQATGDIQKMMFETSPGDAYDVVFSQHVVARYEKKSDTRYDVLRSDRSGAELSRAAGIEPIFEKNHVQVLAQTWNHLTRYLSPSDTGLKQLSTALKPLTDEEYSAYKFVRKSQGDHRTQENPRVLRIAGSAYILLLTGLIYFMIRKQRGSPLKRT